MTQASAPQIVKFRDLPLGARFKYVGGKDVWVVLERYGCGKVAGWKGNILQYTSQSICSAANSEAETEQLHVELVD